MDDPQDYDATGAYDTQTSDTDAIGMANLYPQPTQTYPQQQQGQPAAPVAGQPGLNTLANQTTIQAPQRIYPIYGQQPAAPPPVAPQVIPPQGPTLQATQRPTGQQIVAASQPRPRPQGQGAATISIILGIITIVIGALPIVGIVAVLPGALGVLFGLRGMQTRRRNAAIFGMLLSILGIALAVTLVA